VVVGTATTNPGVPTTADAYATSATTSTATTGTATRWCLVSSITELDIKSFIERINHTVLVVHLVIEKYLVPVLTAYQQARSTAILWFNGEQLVPLGTQYTPT